MLRVVGAGLPRTGTYSLRLALERLLGGCCYHMTEVIEHPEHGAVWQRAAAGDMPDWNDFLHGYVAAVDFPSSAFWPELAAAYPDAIVLLSSRSAPRKWFESVEATIGARMRSAAQEPSPEPGTSAEVVPAMMAEIAAQGRFTGRMTEPEEAIAAYERHNAEVRATVDRDRLVDWQPGDGWPPICAALGLPVPAEPFPHSNSRDEFFTTVQRHANKS